MKRLHLDLEIDAETITGVGRDDRGHVWPVGGWLSLIGLVSALAREESEPPPPDPPAPAAGGGTGPATRGGGGG